MFPRAQPDNSGDDVDMDLAPGSDSGIDMDAFKKLLAKELIRSPRLSGTGPLNMRNEHLALVARSSEGELLCRFLADLAVGAAVEEIVQFLRGGLIVPLCKPGGGHRPLTIANVMRRAALRVLVQQRKEDNAAAVGPLQYAVSRKSGADALYKSIQARLAEHPHSMVLAVDFEAAFQNLDRSAICRAVAKHAPWYEEAFKAWYCGAAQHILYDDAGKCHTIFADRGVDQGCPLGALLFALTLRDAADAVLKHARELDPAAALYMYLDDGYLVVRADISETVLQHLQAEFGKLGIKLNLSKLQVWAPNVEVVPPCFAAYYTSEFKVLK